jgi:hypothetical protein
MRFPAAVAAALLEASLRQAYHYFFKRQQS